MIFISWNILVSLQVSPVALDDTYLSVWLGKAERHQRHKRLSREVSVRYDTTFLANMGLHLPIYSFSHYSKTTSSKYKIFFLFFFIGLQHFHHPCLLQCPKMCKKQNQNTDSLWLLTFSSPTCPSLSIRSCRLSSASDSHSNTKGTLNCQL